MVELNGQLRLHPQFKITAVRVGIEELPVLVIDNFLSNPGILQEYAVAHSSFDRSDTFYPGCRAPIPPIYCFAVRAFLGDFIAKAFDLAASSVTGELSHFSLVSTPPAKLHPLQRCLISTIRIRSSWPCCTTFADHNRAALPFIATAEPASNSSTRPASPSMATRWTKISPRSGHHPPDTSAATIPCMSARRRFLPRSIAF
jgi:hypothetical protein